MARTFLRLHSLHTSRRWKMAAPGFVSAVLIVLLLGFSSNSYAVKTFVLGNDTASSRTTSGPTKDGTINVTYTSKPTVVFSRSSTLTPANVVLNWDGSHGSGTTSEAAYCTRSNKGTGNGFSVESGMVSAGSYNGLDIFKTNIPGLYFSVNLRGFSAANIFTTNVSTLDIRDGIMHQALGLIPTTSNWCDDTNIVGTVNYASDGGFGFYSRLTFYTDQTYTPGASSISLLKTGNYHIRIWNENPGSGIASHYLNITFDISGVQISEPTCSAQPVASGSSVKGDTIDLGRYSPNDIIQGANAVPFAIQLSGCRGLRNINVTLTSTALATDRTLLGNILSSDKATGVGLEISGAANNYHPQMLLIPNDATSVYNDQRDTTNDNNIYGSGESGATQSQTLNFLAKLKRDSNQKIGSGNFKANGIFTLDYP
jgi:P pilus assembly protein, pilin FimA